MGCLGLPSVLLSPSPPTPDQPVTVTSVEKGARSGAKKGLCQPTCLHQPALTVAAKGDIRAGQQAGGTRGAEELGASGTWKFIS